MSQLQINSKAEFYSLSRRDLLGNRLRCWSWAEFEHQYNNGADLPEVIGVRSMDANDSPYTGLYDRDSAYTKAQHHLPRSRDWIFDEALNPEWHIILGELMSDEKHLRLRYSESKMHMRRIWDYERDTPGFPIDYTIVKHATGFMAWALVKTHMDNQSWEVVNDILHDYDHPIIEFSCCDRRVGIQRSNTIIWEVRTGY